MRVDEEILRQRTNELEQEFYGEDNPISEEEIELLKIRLRRERRSFLRRLAEVCELTGYTAAELMEMLDIEVAQAHVFESLVRELSWACEELHSKGYGPEIQRVLTTDGMFGRQGEEPFPSIISIVKSRDLITLHDLSLYMPPATS